MIEEMCIDKPVIKHISNEYFIVSLPNLHKNALKQPNINFQDEIMMIKRYDNEISLSRKLFLSFRAQRYHVGTYMNSLLA